jgi:predicted nucleic acid-binding protein
VATVVDASALGDFLRGTRRTLPPEPIHVPEVCDLEVASQLRTLVRRGIADAAQMSEYLIAYLGLPLRRYSHTLLLQRILQLRDNLTPYDAAYVALAEALDLPLLTADDRLRRAVEQWVPSVRLL